MVGGLESHGISLYENGETSAGSYLTRLIGGGYEVCNTTSELYKQGNCLSACAPQVIERSAIGNLQVGGGNSGSPAFTCRMPPLNPAEVRANPNSVSWEAAHGCYVPIRMDHMKNPFGIQTSIPLLYVLGTAGDAQCLISETDSPSVSGLFPNVTAKPHIAPIADSVTFFTGLSSQTTLTVNVRFIEEVAPISDLDLLAFGPETYEADPLALEYYQRALMKLPVAVTYAENGSAEFWSRVVKTIGSVAAPLAGATLGPLGSGAVNAITGAITARLDKKAQMQAKAKNSPKAVAGKQQQKIQNKKLR